MDNIYARIFRGVDIINSMTEVSCHTNLTRVGTKSHAIATCFSGSWVVATQIAALIGIIKRLHTNK